MKVRLTFARENVGQDQDNALFTGAEVEITGVDGGGLDAPQSWNVTIDPPNIYSTIVCNCNLIMINI